MHHFKNMLLKTQMSDWTEREGNKMYGYMADGCVFYA